MISCFCKNFYLKQIFYKHNFVESVRINGKLYLFSKSKSSNISNIYQCVLSIIVSATQACFSTWIRIAHSSRCKFTQTQFKKWKYSARKCFQHWMMNNTNSAHFESVPALCFRIFCRKSRFLITVQMIEIRFTSRETFFFKIIHQIA